VNNDEARRVLSEQLAPYRAWPYRALCARIGSDVVLEVSGPSGATYQIEIEVRWESRPNADVRVMGSIDDGGWRAFVPLIDSFIKAPDESFVGE
jgi:hypothetical protein